MSAARSPDSGLLRLAAAQLNPTVGDLTSNANQIVAAARRASELDTQLLVCPELAICGYPADDLVLRADFVHACQTTIEDVAVRVAEFSPNMTVVVGSPIVADGQQSADSRPRQRHNALQVLRGGEVVGTYSKCLLPTYGVFDEARVFAAGDRPAAVWNIGGTTVGLSVCEDAWSQHGPAMAQTEAGADVLVVANASPWDTSKPALRQDVISRLAARCRRPVVYVNTVGGQDELVFDGRSFVGLPDGSCHQIAPAWHQGVAVVDVPTHGGSTVAAPAAAQFDPQGMEDLWEALVVGVRDYTTKTGFASALIGLSGGIDSAVTAAVAVDALGPAAVTGVLLPSPHSSDHSAADAQDLAERLGIETHMLPIGPTMDVFDQTLAPVWQQHEVAGQVDVTEENLQARIRGTLLMAISNKLGHLLLTTGNKSEVAVGYCTLYGDMAGGFGVLGDVAKTDVFELARWRNHHAPGGRVEQPIPASSIDKPPSAELAPAQQDTDSLPPYDVLDPLLHQMVVEDASADSLVAAGFDPQDVDLVAGLLVRAEYKRRQGPPVVKTTRRAFGRDRRWPIVNRWQPTRSPEPQPESGREVA